MLAVRVHGGEEESREIVALYTGVITTHSSVDLSQSQSHFDMPSFMPRSRSRQTKLYLQNVARHTA